MFSNLVRRGAFGEEDSHVVILEGTRRTDRSHCVVAVEAETFASACNAPGTEKPLFLETWTETDGVTRSYRLVGLSPPAAVHISAVDSAGGVRVAERAGNAFVFTISDAAAGRGTRVVEITGRRADGSKVYVWSLPDG